MSLQRLKAAFETSAAAHLAPDARAELWQAMLTYMVEDCGGRTLYWHVPTRVPDISLRRRQGELFAIGAQLGLSQRAMAEQVGCSQSTVHRAMSLIHPSAVCESGA